MMDERELRALHGRVVAALTFGAKTGSSRAQLKPLADLRIVLDWILEVETKPVREYAAGIFRQLHNVESLRKHYERNDGAQA